VRRVQAGNNIEYVFPYLLSVYYRNLAIEYVPTLERQVTALRRSASARETLINKQAMEIDLLIRQLSDTDLAKENALQRRQVWEDRYSDMMNQRDRQRKIKKRWRFVAAVAGGIAVAGVLL